MKTYLVCGLGQVGYRICHLLLQLGEKVEVISKETREDWIPELKALGVRIHLADARKPEALSSAGVKEAASLIAVTGQDLINIEIALDARTLRADLPVVLRIFDETLAERLEETLQLRKAIGRSSLAAPVIASGVMEKKVQGSFTVDGHPFLIEEETVGGITTSEKSISSALLLEDKRILLRAIDSSSKPQSLAIQRRSFWNNLVKTWNESTFPFGKVALFLISIMVISAVIFHFAMGLSVVDAIYFITTTVTTVGYGDITPGSASLKLYVCLLMLLGSATIAAMYSWITDFIVTAKFQELFGKTMTPEKDHVVLVGLGKIGYRVAEELRRLGIELLAVETNPGALAQTVRSFAPVIAGDGRTPETLEKAGIRTARAVIAATSDDATNLTTILVSRGLNPGIRTVTRFGDAEFAEKIQKPLKVDVAYSPSRIAAPTFVAAALYENVVGAFLLDGTKLLVFIRKNTPAELVGRQPSELKDSKMHVLFRRNREQLPFVSASQDDSPLSPEDEFIVVEVRDLLSAQRF